MDPELVRSETHQQRVDSFDKEYELLPEQMNAVKALWKSFEKGKYGRSGKNIQKFAINLRRVQALIDSEHDEMKRRRLQVHFGLIVIDSSFMVIQALTLSKIFGSHSLVNSFLKKMGCGQVDKSIATSKIHQTFLNNYKFAIRKWAARYNCDLFNPDKKEVRLEDGSSIRLCGEITETQPNFDPPRREVTEPQEEINLIDLPLTPYKVDIGIQVVEKRDVEVQTVISSF